MKYFTGAASALLGVARDLDVDRLRAGAPNVFPKVLREDPPGSLVDRVVASGDPALLTELAYSEEVARRRPDVLELIAAEVELEVVSGALFARDHWEYRHWEACLRRTTPDGSAPASPPRPWDEYESGETDDVERSALVHSPVPAHCLYRLEHGPALTSREQVSALAGVHRVEGPVAARAAIERFRPTEGPRFAAAMEEPGGIAALLAEVDDTATAIAAFRAEGANADAARRHTRERADLDWRLVATAHAAAPFLEAVVIGLAARADCPEELLHAFYAEHPEAVAKACPNPPVSLFGIGSAKGARALTTRFREQGRVKELVTHGAPAVAVLSEIGQRRRLSPEHAVLGRILAETVGAEPGAWRTLRRLLEDHPGTIRDLCETAAAAPDLDGPWPDATSLDEAYDRWELLPEAREAFVVLLDAVQPSTQTALFPHLDQRTLADLVAKGVWRRTWFDDIVARGTPEQRLTYVRARGELTTEQIQRCLDFGEPAAAAEFIGPWKVTVAQIEHILSGRAFASHPATGPGSPLPPEVKARYLTGNIAWHPRHAVACADLELRRHIARQAPVVGDFPQLRLLLNIWDVDGREAMLAFVEDEKANLTRQVLMWITHLAGLEDEAAAREDLRFHVVARETPEWQIEGLLTSEGFHAESHDWFMPEILDALRQRFGEGAEYKKHCHLLWKSGAFGAPSSRYRPDSRHQALDAGVDFAEVVGEGSESWIETALETARVTWAEVVEHCRPAGSTLRLMSEAHPVEYLPLFDGKALTTEAVVLALRLLYDNPFLGTLPELIAVASAATRETP